MTEPTEPQKDSKVPLIRTIGGLVIAIGSTGGGLFLMVNGAPMSAWVVAFLIALVAAMAVEPTMIAEWLIRREKRD